MKPDDILDAIGMIDDELVKKAKHKKIFTKNVIRTLTSLAACLIAVIVISQIVQLVSSNLGGNDQHKTEFSPPHDDGIPDTDKNEAETNPSDTNAPDNDSQEGNLKKRILIYYVEEREVKSTQQYLTNKSDAVFDAWRQQNNIGDEVRLLLFDIDKDTPSSQKVPCTLNIVISSNIQPYYEKVSEELLLETLEKTMTEFLNIDVSACNITLSE